MLVRLSIEKRSVMEAVSRQTEWEGVKTDVAALSASDGASGGGMKVLATVTGDTPLLQDYWKEAAGGLTSLLGRHVHEVSEDGMLSCPHAIGPVPGGAVWTGYDALLRVPSSWPSALRSGLTASAQGYLVHAVLGRWYRACGMPEKSASAFTSADGYGTNVVTLLCKRR